MRRLRLLRASAALLLLPALAAWAAPLDDALEAIRARRGVIALGGAIFTRDGPKAVGVSGLRRSGGEHPVTAGDLWHLGSCTKSMTATLLARFAEKGKIRFDLTLPEAFPDLAPSFDAAYRDTTLDLLMRHRGGTPADLSFDGLWGRLWKRPGTPEAQRELLTREVLYRPPATPRRSGFLYSNAGFAIAGHALECRVGRPWEELMHAELFTPLGMKSAGFGAPGAGDPESQPWGHALKGASAFPVAPGPGADNPPAIGPAGTVHCSLDDWARYLAIHLREDDGGRYLTAASLHMLHKPRDGENYIAGWAVTERPWGGRVLTHAGSNTMWFCCAWLAPERGFGVVATCNQGGDAAAGACDDAAAELIRRHLTGADR